MKNFLVFKNIQWAQAPIILIEIKSWFKITFLKSKSEAQDNHEN